MQQGNVINQIDSISATCKRKLLSTTFFKSQKRFKNHPSHRTQWCHQFLHRRAGLWVRRGSRWTWSRWPLWGTSQTFRTRTTTGPHRCRRCSERRGASLEGTEKVKLFLVNSRLFYLLNVLYLPSVWYCIRGVAELRRFGRISF